MTVSRETLIARYFPGKEEAICTYAYFLETAGIERGLIGPREGDKIWERHIFNCLPVISLIPEGSTVVDLGSGAGLPGIPIALARPDITMTLIEPLQRRVDFLNEATSELAISVLRGRGQDHKIKVDRVIARAVAPMATLKTMAWHLLKPSGALLAIKGEAAAAEALTLPGCEVHEIQLEDLALGRVISLHRRA